MKDPDHARFADWDAAYVLGGLSPADRREFEDHLEDCERCRAAVQELSGVPGLLGRIDDARAFALLEDDGAEAPMGPAAPLAPARGPALAAPSRRRSRLRRIGVRVGALAAAAAIASALTLALPAVFRTEPAADAQVVFQPVAGQQLPITMSLTASSVDWGTRLDVHCFYSAATGANASYGPVPYSLWVVGDDGTETSVSTWQARPGTEAALDAGTATALDDIAAFQLRTLDGGETLMEGRVSD